MKRFSMLVVFLFIFGTVYAQVNREEVTFYASFDKGINADKAAGLNLGVFNAKRNSPDFNKAIESQKDPLLKLVPGLKGNGLLTGVNGQVVYYKAEGNINPGSWTVTFWVKGLEGKNYLSPKKSHQQLFEMCGGGWTRFYKYKNAGDLMVLITKKGPNNERISQSLHLKKKMEVNKWNFFALTYKKGNGVSIYLNGKLAARDAGMEPIQHPAWFRVGQSFGGDKEPNRIIDEFKIYNKALTEDEIFQKFLKEGHLRTNQKVLVPETSTKIVIDGKIGPSEWKDAVVISGFINNANASAAETQSRVYITYDKTYLYLAFRLPERYSGSGKGYARTATPARHPEEHSPLTTTPMLTLTMPSAYLSSTIVLLLRCLLRYVICLRKSPIVERRSNNALSSE